MSRAPDVMRRGIRLLHPQHAGRITGRRLNYLFAAVLLAVLSTIATPVHAADLAVCVASHPLALSPGLTLTAGQHRYTNGSIGTINCLGLLNGHQIVGTGSLTDEGVLIGTCLEGGGSGEFRLRIPTDHGTVLVAEKYSFRYLGVAGTFSGPVFSGAFQFLPQVGDCLLAPLTQVSVLAQGTIASP
jgi:hypothetical protein